MLQYYSLVATCLLLKQIQTFNKSTAEHKNGGFVLFDCWAKRFAS